MKLPDLPAHPVRRSFIRSSGTLSNNGWTSAEADAIRQIQREAALWALEEAAKVINPPRFANEADRIIAWDCVNAILALKEQIE